MLLALGVVVAIVTSVRGKGAGGAITEVRGVIGSEKQAFFRDPAVIAAFRKHGLSVSGDTAGSREIASTTDLSQYDFAFPAGAQAVPPIKRKLKATREYAPFQTMVIASFADIAGVLSKAGVANLVPAPAAGTGASMSGPTSSSSPRTPAGPTCRRTRPIRRPSRC